VVFTADQTEWPPWRRGFDLPLGMSSETLAEVCREASVKHLIVLALQNVDAVGKGGHAGRA